MVKLRNASDLNNPLGAPTPQTLTFPNIFKLAADSAPRRNRPEFREKPRAAQSENQNERVRASQSRVASLDAMLSWCADALFLQKQTARAYTNRAQTANAVPPLSRSNLPATSCRAGKLCGCEDFSLLCSFWPQRHSGHAVPLSLNRRLLSECSVGSACARVIRRVPISRSNYQILWIGRARSGGLPRLIPG